jgi:ketosteroid isomerase-like protein
VVGTLFDGTRLDMWWRSTAGFRKIDGRWRITHEHNSVPFDPQTGKASLDLEP